MKKFKHLAVGGTFDRLHNGHRAFLKFAFDVGERVSVGLTSDTMAAKIGKSNFLSFDQRKLELVNFLNASSLSSRFNLIAIDNVYGNTLFDKSVDGIVVTPDSKSGADEINSKRRKIGLAPLVIVNFKKVKSDDGRSLSSTLIRNGQVNREGKVFRYLIPDTLRPILGKPQGKLLKSLTSVYLNKLKSAMVPIITVGDEIARAILKSGLVPRIVIIDLKINRREMFQTASEIWDFGDRKTVKVENARGTISAGLISVLEDSFRDLNKLYLIEVNGEEDLAVLPAVLLAPLGSIVLYGQRDRGVVEVIVTERKKADYLKFLDKFKTV